MKTPKRVVVSKKLSDQQIVDAARWNDFIKASNIPLGELTTEWWDFFDALAEPETAPIKLVKLLDIASEHDMLSKTK